jgi:hypothetical protein
MKKRQQPISPLGGAEPRQKTVKELTDIELKVAKLDLIEEVQRLQLEIDRIQNTINVIDQERQQRISQAAVIQ